jgi:hypothetical protein
VDIALRQPLNDSLHGRSFIYDARVEMPNQICSGCFVFCSLGLPAIEWRRLAKSIEEESRLCMRLPQDEILRLHDRSQNGGAVRMWN